MSKLSMLICSAIVALALVVFAGRVSAQVIQATIDIDAGVKPTAYVRGAFFTNQPGKTRRNFSLLRSVAGHDRVAGRVSEVELFDVANKPIAFKKLVDGEYLSETDIVNFSYKVDLAVPGDRNAAAHVSWLSGDTGILMLADLLPRVGSEGPAATVSIRFRSAVQGSAIGPGALPLFSAEKEVNSAFAVHSVDDAIIYVGNGWGKGRSLSPAPVDVIISGKWNFESHEAVNLATEIHNAYHGIFRARPKNKPMVAIAKFPQQTPFGQWQAETRGNNVTIISSDMPFKSQSIQRLHEQLRHELFHLWIPNDVSLTGTYDWFYEGFALYQSLRMAVAMNQIRFSDFLDTLSRAHTIDSAQSHSVSLIDASKSRFSGSDTRVYARGMLVAFMIDVELLDRSKGKRSVENLLRELYSKHKRPSTAADGNTAVIAHLKENPGLELIVLKYVTGTDRIDWTNRLAVAGISDVDAGPSTTLKVNEKLSGRQKTLLDKLGYNNWRKLSPSSK